MQQKDGQEGMVKMTPYFITGANGQLGSELRRLLDEKHIPYTATDVAELDITDAAAVEQSFMQQQPKVVFHCAAYTAVDKAEDEAKALNWKINVDGTENIAKAAEKVGATVVYLSTDYVFDGTLTPGEEYQPDDPTNPQNEYGRAKLAGEKAVENFCTHSYIVRTSWVFGKFGHNFVFTMLKLAKTHDHLTVVNDQYGRPTWTRDLAEFLLFLVEQAAPMGIYQFSNEGSCSWYEFAKAILADKEVTIKPVTSSEYPQKAHRPQYSVMSLAKVEALGYHIPDWQTALTAMLQDCQQDDLFH